MAGKQHLADGKKSKRGGKQPGAGRPRTLNGRANISISLESHQIDWLDQQPAGRSAAARLLIERAILKDQSSQAFDRMRKAD